MKDKIQSEKANNFYITTAIYYPNGEPHVGHAYEVLITDVIARYHRMLGEETYFLTGTDENTSKVVKAAKKTGKKDVEAFTDKIVELFKMFFKKLNASYDQFIRTSDEERHWPGATAVWDKLVKAGDIYKGTYTGLYCEGSESFVTEKDLVDGKCPDHDEVPREIKEENYFFKLSKYTKAVREKIESGELQIFPKTRKNEILSLLNEGLQDVSFSRPKKEIPWGIPVPGDKTQMIYVWCDALTNYISALGYGRDDENFRKFWPVDWHVIGKDILRFHAAIWPAMLLSAGIPLPKRILVHGMILSGGRKMSKSLGNVINPNELIDEYGTDALRYYLSREVSPFEDGDMTSEKFKEAYNANLANGLGNLVSRVMKMAIQYEVSFDELILDNAQELLKGDEFEEYKSAMEKFEVNRAADFVWSLIAFMDSYVEETKPFKTIEEDPEKARRDVLFLVERLWEVAALLEPFMPDTAEEIQNSIKEREMPEPLFVRK